MGDPGQGIVHVIGPQLGLTQPGLTIVCGDSHTSTHGAFGALAFGIGTSEVEHVLATQTLPQSTPGTMAITVDGDLPPGVTAKDVILGIIARIGTGGGVGSVIEYRGSAIRALSMEGRMTVCNMSIEAGARAGLIAPDDTTFAYLEGRPHAPKGAAWEAGARRLAHPAHRRRRRLRQGDRDRRRRSAPLRHLGHQPGADRSASTRRCPTPTPSPSRRPRRRPPGPCTTWASPPGTPIRDIAGRHRVHRLVHQRPPGGPAGRRRRAAGPPGRERRAGHGRPGLDAGEGRRRGRGPRRDLHGRPASSGGRPGAPCAWA